MKKTSVVLFLLVLLGACSGNSGSTQQSPTTVAAPTTTEPEKVTIPELTGLSKEEGLRILRDLGFVVTLKEFKSENPAGSIVSLSPSPGKSVDPGWRIELRYAIPMTYGLQVKFEVKDGFARNLGDGFCDFPRKDVVDGQSFVLVGPFGEQLSAILVPEKGRWSTVDSKTCEYNFSFTGLPKVATYRLQLPDGDIFPPASFEDLDQYGWDWNWFWGRG